MRTRCTIAPASHGWENLRHQLALPPTADHPELRPEFPLASPTDIDIPRCVDTAQEAIGLIRLHHEEWIGERAGSLAR